MKQRLLVDYNDFARSDGADKAFRMAAENLHWDAMQQIHKTGKVSPEAYGKAADALNYAENDDALVKYLSLYSDEMPYQDVEDFANVAIYIKQREDMLLAILGNSADAFETEQLEDMRQGALEMNLVLMANILDETITTRAGNSIVTIDWSKPVEPKPQTQSPKKLQP